MSSGEAERQIVVLGGGYTGILAAMRTARRTRRHGGRVVLVNATSRFTERLRMHQLATGQDLEAFEIPELIDGLGIDFVEGWVTVIDPDGHRVAVATDGGEVSVHYDTLVYALGSTTPTDLVPGADSHALTLNDPTSAARLATCLAGLSDAGTGTVVVAGNGLTGIEVSSEIAESFPALDVVLVGRDELVPRMGPKARAHVVAVLERLGVTSVSGVEITKVLPDALELADGQRVSSDATLWTTGFRASPVAAEAGIAVDDTHRIVVDPALRSVSHPNVVAIGDAAAIHQPWGVIHGTCQSGMPSAAHAADNIGRVLGGRKAKTFRFGYLHQPVSLGRGDAVIQFTRPDDSPARWYLAGKAAVRYKETVTASPLSTYRLSRRFTIPKTLIGRRPRKPLPRA